MNTIMQLGRIAALVEKQAFDLSKITPAPKKQPTDPSKNITQSVGDEPLQYPEHLRGIDAGESYPGPPTGGTMTYNDHIDKGRIKREHRERTGVPRTEYYFGGANLGTPQGRAAIQRAGLGNDRALNHTARERLLDYGHTDFINANTDKVPSTVPRLAELDARRKPHTPWAHQLGQALGRMVGGGASPNDATRNVIQNKTQGAR